jgi:D-arabinose 1-dehydrogenase-like Zn-dependent alcohol dehydrogenase
MTHAIRIHAPGGADALRYEAVDLPAPGPGQATVRHTAIGVNFIDVYQRSGLYGIPAPFSLGMEGAGVVEAVGPDVVHVKPGDRVAYTGSPPGSYSTARTLPAGILVRLPDGIDDDVAASIMLKGMTSWYLLKRTHVARAGEAILVHAAAGGVGQILCQWAAHIGCTVIGTVGSDEKAAIARACGCHHPIVYTREDFVARVKEITGGTGVPGLVRLPAQHGPPDQLRPVVRPAARDRDQVAGAEVREPDPPDPVPLHRPAGGPRDGGGRTVRDGDDGHRQDRPAGGLSAGRRRPGAPGPRRPPDHGLDRPAALSGVS